MNLAVHDYGGSGPPMVCVHGLSSNLHIWDLVAPLLVERFHVIAFDQRNHGLSADAEDFSFAALAADVGSIAPEDAFVVGHSWGASVALHYAAGRPSCPGVVCVDGGVVDMQGMGMSWPDAERMLRPPDLEGPPDELVARILREQSVLPAEAVERVVRRGFPVGPDGVMRRRLPIDKHMRIVRELWSERIGDVYERLRSPVMLVLAEGLGRDDRERAFTEVKREGVRRLRERLGETAPIRVEWLPSVHDVPLLHPAELASLIIDQCSS